MLYYRKFNFEKFYNEARESTNIYEISTKTKENEETEPKGKKYSNMIFSFDTETTSYFIHKETGKIEIYDYTKNSEYYKYFIKQSLLYIWMFNINGVVLYGRDLTELKDFFNKFTKVFIENEIECFIYVHNLGFDFTSLSNIWNYDDMEIFTREERKIMKMTYKKFITFRDSLCLTNKKLETAAEDLKTKHQKQTGHLDYNILRTPYSKLTEEEIKYCEFDVVVLNEIVEKYKEKFKNISQIPLTQTGIVRNELKRVFFKDSLHHKQMSEMEPTFEEYEILSSVYSGGYTHANMLNANKILKEIYSYDISSSYPTVLCIEKYPQERFFEVNIPLNKIDREKYCYIVDFDVFDLKSKYSNSFISLSKEKSGVKLEGLEVDNGRIRKLKYGSFILCDVDFEHFIYNYSFKIKVNRIYIAKKAYLPKKFIELVLKLYVSKTCLKGVEEKESIYRENKEMLNSLYGMCCTKESLERISYTNDGWITELFELEEKRQHFEEKRSKKGLNLTFSWGVWCAAYARGNLWSMIEKIDKNVVYCDTDSVKFIGKENCELFNEYNKKIDSKVFQLCLEYNIDPAKFRPKDIKNKVHPLGYFEFEEKYLEFITLGAKKYAYKHINKKTGEEEICITVSGVRKGAAKFLKSLKNFNSELIFTPEQTGKMLCIYNDEQIEIKFEDGWSEKCKHGVCLIPAAYKMSFDLEQFTLNIDNYGSSF